MWCLGSALDVLPLSGGQLGELHDGRGVLRCGWALQRSQQGLRVSRALGRQLQLGSSGGQQAAGLLEGGLGGGLMHQARQLGPQLCAGIGVGFRPGTLRAWNLEGCRLHGLGFCN